MRFKEFKLNEFAPPSVDGKSILDALLQLLQNGDPNSPGYKKALELGLDLVDAVDQESNTNDAEHPPENTPVQQQPGNTPTNSTQPINNEPVTNESELGNFNETPKIPPKLIALFKSKKLQEKAMQLLGNDPDFAHELEKAISKETKKEYTRGKKDQTSKNDADMQMTLNLAQNVADRTGMGGSEFWRNTLIGQLSPIKEKEKHIFLNLCINGEALLWDNMKQQGNGVVGKFINEQIRPFWSKIEKGIFSMQMALSVGGGQSGNGEALIAMMIGGQKPKAGGDLEINGERYEIKATQADIAKSGAVRVNDAWLEGESTKATDVKVAIQTWIRTNKLQTKITSKILDDADFRKHKMPGMNLLLSKLNRPQAIDLLMTVHQAVFPVLAQRTPKMLKYFTAKMLTGSEKRPKLDYEDVKKYQGGMGIFEYAYGKHKSRNFLFLSSVKGKSDIGFVITQGAANTVRQASTPGSDIQFSAGISFQGTGIKKASPGVQCFVKELKSGSFDMELKSS
jgi:hypothetical protein